MKDFQPNSLQRKIKDISLEVLFWIFALFLYVIILYIPIPVFLSHAIRYSDLLVFAPVAGLIYITYQFNHRWSFFVGLNVVILLFAIALSGLWSINFSGTFLLSSLVPRSDGSSYFRVALQLLHGLTVNLGFLRPFAPGFLSVLLALTQVDLIKTVGTLVAIMTTSTFLLSWEVKRTHGALAGTAIVVGIFIYSRQFLGSVMTEPLGIAFGCLSFALLWRAISKQHRWLFLMGFALFGYGLLTRMGAIFILPFLLLWGAIVFARPSQRFSISILGIGTSILVLEASFNSAISKYISSGNYISFGNYAYTLYGLLKGGRWTQFHQDHPDIVFSKTLPLDAKIHQAYEICFQILREDPFSLIRGIIRAWAQFFQEGLSLFFIDASTTTSIAYTFIVTYCLIPLTAIGFLVCLRFWRQPFHSLLLVFSIGTLASTALAPIWDAGLRPYAVSITTPYLLVAIGINFLQQWGVKLYNYIGSRLLQANRNNQLLDLGLSIHRPTFYPSTLNLFSFPIIGLSILLVIGTSLGPIYLKARVPESRLAVGRCLAHEKAIPFYYHPHSSINLVPNESISHSKIPNLRVDDFRTGLQWHAIKEPEFAKALGTIALSNSIINSPAWSLTIVAPTHLLPQKKGYILGCGQYKEPYLNTVTGDAFYLFEATSLSPIEIVSKQNKTPHHPS